jgi:Domain of unknown function (DUF4403)
MGMNCYRILPALFLVFAVGMSERSTASAAATQTSQTDTVNVSGKFNAIDIAVSLPLDSFTQGVERAVASSIDTGMNYVDSGISAINAAPNKAVQENYKATRDPFAFSVKDISTTPSDGGGKNIMSIQGHISYTIQTRVQTANNVFQPDSKCNGTMDFSFSRMINIKLSPDFSYEIINPSAGSGGAESLKFVWNNPQYSGTPKYINLLMESFKSKIESKIKEGIKSIDNNKSNLTPFKPVLQNAWQGLKQPFMLTDNVWLDVKPKSISYTSSNIVSKPPSWMLVVMFQVDCTPRITYGSHSSPEGSTAGPVDLPQVKQGKMVASKCTIDLKHEIKQSDVSTELNKAIAGLHFSSSKLKKQKKFTISEGKLSYVKSSPAGADNHLSGVIIELKTSDAPDVKITVTGNPVYQAASNAFILDNFDYQEDVQLPAWLSCSDQLSLLQTLNTQLTSILFGPANKLLNVMSVDIKGNQKVRSEGAVKRTLVPTINITSETVTVTMGLQGTLTLHFD